MTLWRISRHRDLSGIGGLRVPGRWHERGSPIVYLAESPAGALLEACVHTSINDVPPAFTLLEVKFPDGVRVVDLDIRELPRDWTEHAPLTRVLGSQWLKSGASALARVPSALIPATWNVLLNPLHPEAKRARILAAHEYPFDPRLKR
jgi:RES domain-containing protein